MQVFLLLFDFRKPTSEYFFLQNNLSKKAGQNDKCDTTKNLDLVQVCCWLTDYLT